MITTPLRSFLLSGLVASTLLHGPAFAQPPTLPKIRLQTPTAQLWVQTSAEYRASALQTYRMAEMQLDRWAAGFRKGAGGKAVREKGDLPVAIVLDLDETVIDNIGFQIYGTTQPGFDPAEFSAWVQFQATHKEAALSVPGAVAFLRKAEAAGITPFYISNRLEEDKAATIQVLRQFGLNVDGIEQRLLLSQGPAGDRAAAEKWMENKRLTPEMVARLTQGEGLKELRRLEVARTHEVVAYFGDQLGDFDPFVKPEGTGPDYVSRRARADDNAARWGTEWFVLPNPMYGGWVPRGDIPEEVLVKTRPLVTDFGFADHLKTIKGK